MLSIYFGQFDCLISGTLVIYRKEYTNDPVRNSAHFFPSCIMPPGPGNLRYSLTIPESLKFKLNLCGPQRHGPGCRSLSILEAVVKVVVTKTS